MVCLGFEPGAAGWLTKTKARSYGGHTFHTLYHRLYRLSFFLSFVLSLCLSLSLYFTRFGLGLSHNLASPPHILVNTKAVCLNVLLPILSLSFLSLYWSPSAL